MNLFQTFGLGRLPPEADFLIPPDSRRISCEHLSGNITFRNFRSPGRACTWKRQWFAGSIAVSDKRIIAFRGSKRLINAVFDDPRFDGLSFTADDDMLLISHDASLYRSDWFGILEYRFRTPEACRIADTIRNAAATFGRNIVMQVGK